MEQEIKQDIEKLIKKIRTIKTNRIEEVYQLTECLERLKEII